MVTRFPAAAWLRPSSCWPSSSPTSTMNAAAPARLRRELIESLEPEGVRRLQGMKAACYFKIPEFPDFVAPNRPPHDDHQTRLRIPHRTANRADARQARR